MIYAHNHCFFVWNMMLHSNSKYHLSLIFRLAVACFTTFFFFSLNLGLVLTSKLPPVCLANCTRRKKKSCFGLRYSVEPVREIKLGEKKKNLYMCGLGFNFLWARHQYLQRLVKPRSFTWRAGLSCFLTAGLFTVSVPNSVKEFHFRNTVL